MRRCPHRGGRDVFRSYLKSRESCPTCGIRLERGERDYFIGAYTTNLIVAEMMVFFGGLAVLVASWPDVPWTGLMYGLAALMVVGPIILYPFSRRLWLALDLVFRPAEPAHFDPPQPPPPTLRTSSREQA